MLQLSLDTTMVEQAPTVMNKSFLSAQQPSKLSRWGPSFLVRLLSRHIQANILIHHDGMSINGAQSWSDIFLLEKLLKLLA
jgi:hypothetical protein